MRRRKRERTPRPSRPRPRPLTVISEYRVLHVASRVPVFATTSEALAPTVAEQAGCTSCVHVNTPFAACIAVRCRQVVVQQWAPSFSACSGEPPRGAVHCWRVTDTDTVRCAAGLCVGTNTRSASSASRAPGALLHLTASAPALLRGRLVAANAWEGAAKSAPEYAAAVRADSAHDPPVLRRP
jgi:hypothetical protein